MEFPNPQGFDNGLANVGNGSDMQSPVEEDPGMKRPKPVENRDSEGPIEGRRIVDVTYVLNQFVEKFNGHNPIMNCSLADLIQVMSRRYGLQTQIFFQCQACRFQDSIWTSRTDDDTMGINKCAVAGTMAIGIGYSQLEELLASMHIPCMSVATYRRYDMSSVETFEQAALAEMLRAGEVAKELAMERGDFIIHEGKKVPFITVVADCAWMKRSYSTSKYNSLSGVGTIVDLNTGKVIFCGVRNKFCFICEWAERHNVTPKPHVCFKNWGRNQASTGMEADVLLDGFKMSIAMHGVILKTLIADGDSNVYKSIRDNDPYGKYGVSVEKKECVNHLLRNLATKVKNIAKEPGRNISHLRKLVEGSAKRFRDPIELAIKHHRAGVQNCLASQDQIRLLKRDVLNAPYHVFGDHRKCNQVVNGFCVEQTTDEALKLVADLQKSELLQKLERPIEYVAYHSDSLIYHANNNLAEAFNSLVAKVNAGKRLNLGMRGSFQGRCAAAVLQYNTHNMLTKFHETDGKIPPATVVALEARRQRKVANNAHIRQRTKAAALAPQETTRHQGRDQNYGPNAEQPDMPAEKYAESCQTTENFCWSNNKTGLILKFVLGVRPLMESGNPHGLKTIDGV